MFQSECLLRLEQLDKARKLINEVRADELSQVEFVDYSFVWAAIAIETGRRDLLERAERILRQATWLNPTSTSAAIPAAWKFRDAKIG